MYKTTKIAATSIPVRGFFVASTVFAASESPQGKPFLEAFRAQFKTDPVWGAHYAYDAVYALTGAIQHAKSAEHAQVLETLRNTEPKVRVNQQLRFAQSGEQKYPVVGIYQVIGGAWVVKERSDAW